MSSGNAPAREPDIRRLIALRAYELWEDHGRPHGCDLIDWRQAEQEIRGCLQENPLTPGRAQPGPSGEAPGGVP